MIILIIIIKNVHVYSKIKSMECWICLKTISQKQSKLKCDECTKEYHLSYCKMSKADLDYVP